MPVAPAANVVLAGFVAVVTGACGSEPSVDVVVERQGDPVVDAGPDDAGSPDDVDAGSPDDVDAGSPDDAGSLGDAGTAVTEPEFASIPWETGDDTGFGVARKDTGNPRGDSVFIGYGGYGATRDAACAWTGALYAAALRERGVRFVYCVQGPSTVQYVQREIGNSRIARHLVQQVTDRTRFVLVAGHSSGSFVAHELLQQLAAGFDDAGVTADRVVYVDLDGGASGLTFDNVARLRRAYFVGAVDGNAGTQSPNRATMVSLGATYASRGRAFDVDADDAGCAAGAVWCVHMVPVIARPHDPLRADVARDYSDFEDRPVATAWIDAIADEAGLVLP